MDEITSIFEMYTPPDLEFYASGYQDENYVDDRPAEEYDWQLVPKFPLTEFLKPSQAVGDMNTPESWTEFFHKEVEMSKQDRGYDYGNWEGMDQEDIQDPVVVSYDDDGKWHIWDGWHRTSASFAGGKSFVPAVVGTPKREVMR